MRFGTLLVGIVAVVAYYFGVPLLPLLAFIIVGTCIEFYLIERPKGQKRRG